MKIWPLACAIPLVFAQIGAAQQNVGVPAASATQTSAADQARATTPEPQNKPEGRLFGVLPNHLTIENASQLPAMSIGDKFKTETRDAFDIANFAWYGLLAGVAQAENSEPSFGQGAEGYGKRYGSQFGDGVVENFSTRAIYPSILHQDPRYFQLGKGSIPHRIWYSVSRVFITLGDNRHEQFNYSEILGSASAAAISTYTFHPAEDRNAGTVLTVWGEQIGYDALSYLAKEFWPDVRRKLSHKSTSSGKPD